MSRKTRHSANRRRILTVAGRLVEKSGPESLSLREVARKSGYSPAALYGYFDGRDAILTALAERDAAALAEILRTDPGAEHPLVDLGLTWLGFAESHPGRLKSALRHPGDEIPEVFRERVEACVASGEIMPGPGFDVAEIAGTLQAMAAGAALMGHTPQLLREGLRCLLLGLRG